MSDPITISTFEVRKDQWRDTRVVTEQVDAALGDNEVLFKVDRLALTSNNISYAVAGDMLRYWDFFPSGVLMRSFTSPVTIWSTISGLPSFTLYTRSAGTPSRLR